MDDTGNTVFQLQDGGIELMQDNEFSLEGFQVARGEFFAHTYEPGFTLTDNKVYVNMACIKKLPDVEYVQILVNPERKKLCVRPCREDEKDSFLWKSKGKKTAPKQITCRIFYGKIIELMGWDPANRYKLLGKLIRTGSELLFVFDLTTPQIFMRKAKDGGTSVTEKKASFPQEWKNQFGVLFEEHERNMQIKIFHDYAVFSLDREKTKNNGIKEVADEPVDGNGEPGNMAGGDIH